MRTTFFLLLLSGFSASIYYLTGETFKPSAAILNDKAALGKLLFFETRLSEPEGQSCASCHDPLTGFADPEAYAPTSSGALEWVFGARNAPSAAYASFSPPLHYDETIASYVGGQFWDGRVDTLREQAEGPFLNPLEMHNYNKWLVIEKLIDAGLAPAFRKVYGKNSLRLRTDADANAAFSNIADAIAEYERSAEVNRFNSKFDQVLRGKDQLTEQEALGLTLFNGKARCGFCHPSTVQGGEPGPLFTNFLYTNLGIPKNWDSPFLYMSSEINPFGEDFTDVGLGNTVHEFYPEGAMWEDGKFKTPTLRNVELTAPYGHNGFFQSLKEIVHFYNTRDVAKEAWPPSEVYDNVNERIGNLGLTDEEEDAIVAFLKTLTDR